MAILADYLPPSPPQEDISAARASVRSYIDCLLSLIVWLWDQLVTMQRNNQELQNRLNANSSNSSRPPSTDSPYQKNSKGKNTESKSSDSSTGDKKNSKGDAKATANADDAQPQKKKARHPGKAQTLMKPTQVVDCYVDGNICPVCGQPHLQYDGYKVHQNVELPQQPLIVTHCHLHRGICPDCGHVTFGQIPKDYIGSLGPRLMAFIAFVDSRTATTRRQLQDLLANAFSFHFSQGAIQNCIDRVSEALEPLYARIIKATHGSPLNHVDETSWPTFGPILGKGLHWLWVMSNKFLTFFRIDGHRSKEAFNKLIGFWKGILVSDDFTIYRLWEGEGRQTCLAHLMRKAIGFLESTIPIEAKCGKRSAAALKALMDLAGTEPSAATLKKLRARFARLVHDFGAYKKIGPFTRRLLADFDAMTLFLRNPVVEKTNNHAERQIRYSVSARKVSFGSVTEKGEKWVERSLSVGKTSDQRQIPYYRVLVDAISSHKQGRRPNMYWLSKARVRAQQYYSQTSKKGQKTV